MAQQHSTKPTVAETCYRIADAVAENEGFTVNAVKVLEKRYFKKDDDGRPLETPGALMRRVARCLAAPDLRWSSADEVRRLEEEFHQMLMAREFIPNSPTLMNAGRPLGQLSACFVLPVPDSLDRIFDTIKHAALIHKSGGGTGFAFSRLRPKNDIVASTKGVSSGPVSFMQVFDAATEAIKQGGTRRGANMGILRVDHPDILDFVACKASMDRITNFNISVAITEDFMEAVKEDRDYELKNPRSGEVVGRLNAKSVFDKIVENAWLNGDPGIVFIDRINRDNPTPQVGDIESTNPCGEQPLLPYESCNLGSINLGKAVQDGAVNWEKLRRLTRRSIHFLDNVIEANNYPIPEIDEMTKANRKIGIGVMGWADMLIQLEIPYDSEEAVELGERLIKFVREEADEASRGLAEVRGPFPNFYGSIYKDDPRPLRNSTRVTIAPTGTISIIAGCSSGVEPLFAVSYVRNVMDNDLLIEVNPLFEQIAKHEGFYSDALMREIAEHGTVRGVEGVPEKWQRVFATSHDITPYWHVRHQAAFQKWTDNAVSKTVNFPNDAEAGDVREVYVLAYELGCKGVTIYRDGSRVGQVLTPGQKLAEKAKAEGTGDKAPMEDRRDNRLSKGLSNDRPAAPAPVHANGNGNGRAKANGNGAAHPTNGNGRAQAANGNGNGHAKPAPAPAPEAIRVDQFIPVSDVAAPMKVQPRPRPKMTVGATVKMTTGCGPVYVTVNGDSTGMPFEVFNQMGKAGGCAAAQTEAIGRLVSLALRSHVEPETIVSQLKGIQCHRPAGYGAERTTSCADATAKALERYLEHIAYDRSEQSADAAGEEASTYLMGESNYAASTVGGMQGYSTEGATPLYAAGANPGSSPAIEPRGGACKECGGTVEHEGGCMVCRACGYSECG